MFHAYATRFDVTMNLEIFFVFQCELNKAYVLGRLWCQGWPSKLDENVPKLRPCLVHLKNQKYFKIFCRIELYGTYMEH